MTPALKLKPTHKALRYYCAGLTALSAERSGKESTVRPVLFTLLDHCALSLGCRLNTAPPCVYTARQACVQLPQSANSKESQPVEKPHGPDQSLLARQSFCPALKPHISG